MLVRKIPCRYIVPIFNLPIDVQLSIGIRPEDITADGDGAQLEGVVCGGDTLGDKSLAEIDISKNHSLTVFLEKPVKGAAHRLTIDTSRLYLFDGETQLTLLKRDEGYIADAKNTEADFVPLSKGEMDERIKQFAPPEVKKAKKR